jgi:3'-phosphoadenosine 5'-phosphosulfate sulfotransferase (PAPS reductase)/FAD synthetase
MILQETLEFIRQKAHKARKPAAMLSFGKDSMVMAWLIREALAGEHGLNGEHFPLPHAFPLPIIYHREPWFAFKHDFADHVIQTWAMEAHDFPPLYCGVKTNQGMIEPVARYQLGSSAIDVPKNLCMPDPRRDYICGLHDWIGRPQAALASYPWDLLFIGHKSSDVDPFDGHVPLKNSTAEIGGVTLAFPLKDWSDSDVWDAIEFNHIAVDSRRYKGRREVKDRWYHNDYVHGCMACIDPRCKEKEVFCPKLKRNVRNLGPYVLQLHADAPYIERKED